VAYYERNLPHWHPEGAEIFLTWCLHGVHLTAPQNQAENAGRAFLLYDRALDRASTGPKWLLRPYVAQCVVDSLRFGEQQLNLYHLLAFCVMPNHVHAVIEPRSPVAKITRSIKGFSARGINRILKRTGEPLWQDETYDHWIRDGEERNRIIRYVEQNPVAAGLVETLEQWPWSSAWKT
jgi:putative transposase